MRDFITFTALIVSLSGIAVSLAREEVRCYIGLNAEPCQVKQPETPGSNRQEASAGSSEGVGDRQQSDSNSNSSESSPSSKSLNKDNPSQVLPSSADSQARTQSSSPDNQPAINPETPPAHTELKVAPEATIPAPSAEQPFSVRQNQNNNETSAQSSTNIPIKVEPYSPPQSNN